MDMTTPVAEPVSATLHQLVADRLPHWILQAPASTHAALRQASAQAMQQPWFENARIHHPERVARLLTQAADYHTRQQRIAPLFERLGQLQAFAEPRLVDGLRARFGMQLDVRNTYLLHASHARTDNSFIAASRDPLVAANRALRDATRPLLDAALQNFQAAEAQSGGMDRDERLKAEVFDSYQILGPSIRGNALPVPAHEFAALCRLLDLGGQYQAHIERLFTPQAALDLQGFERASLLLELHLARIRERLDPDSYQAMLALLEEPAGAHHADSDLVCSVLRLWDVELCGVLLFSKDRDLATRKEPVVVYIPDDPVAPLQCYSSTLAFHDELRRRLLSKGYLEFFSRFIPARQRGRVMDQLYARLYPSTTRRDASNHAWRAQFADPQARLHLGESRLSGALFEALYQRKLAFIKDNARFHAVPTAEQDQRAQDERLAWWRDVALNTLNVAAFVTPVLGELMLTVTAAQLGYEVFEGIESWSRGDQAQALDCLMDVLQNLAQVAVLGAAHGQAGEWPALPASELIESLRPVSVPGGRTRLWKADLLPFAHDFVLPADLAPDANGLVAYQGRRWLVLDGRHYSVIPASEGNGHVLEHPQRPDSYQPPLRHNGERAWLHELDAPERMHGLTLLRRLGFDAGRFPDPIARHLLTICGLPESVLRQALQALERPPALLSDSALRLSLYGEAAGHAEYFQHRYQNLQTSSDPLLQALQARLPSALPRAVAEELLDACTPEERAALATTRTLAPRLADEARLYAQQVRLARAYESLYLDALRNPDSDRLALHSLACLPGWRSDIRLEVRDGHFHAALLDSLGAEQAPIRKVLVKTPDGYEPRDADGQHLDGRDDLFAAIMHALPDAHRQAIGLPHVGQGAALRELIGQHPLPRRQARVVLGMQVIRPGFRSPMRLADGRLGYPLSGRPAPDWAYTRESLQDKIRLLEFEDLYPDQLYQQLMDLGLSHAQLDARLNTLLDERLAMGASLATWAEQSAAIPGLLADASRMQTRTATADAIWRHWRMNCLHELAQRSSPLLLPERALDDFPDGLPGFFRRRVTRLEIAGTLAQAVPYSSEQRLQALLEQFENVEVLDMHRAPTQNLAVSVFSDLPEVILRSLPQLRELRLDNLGLLIDQPQIDTLQRLPRLRRLDLSGNRFSTLQPIDLSGLQVEQLLLERVGLEHWPAWLEGALPSSLCELSLADNQLTSLPDTILANPPALLRQCRLNLRGNPLSNATRLRARLSERSASVAYQFDLDVSPALHAQLEQLFEEHRALSEAIERWVGAPGPETPLTAQRIAARQHIGEVLLDYWHACALGNGLNPLLLDSVDLAEFPQALPDFLTQRVRAASLLNVRTTPEGLDAWLRRFARLSQLHIQGGAHGLPGFPQALAHLPELNSLALLNQGLILDQTAVDFLAGLPALEILELDGNRLGTITDVSAWRASHLRWLSLRNTGLQEWPQWLLELLPAPLEALILDNNQLRSIPESLLANPRSDNAHCDINLQRNPLSRDSLLRAHVSEAYNRGYSFLLDLPDDIRQISWREPHESDTEGSDSDSDSSGHRHGAAAPDTEVSSVEAWLGADATAAERRELWQRLATDTMHQRLLELIGQLRHSADYRRPGSRAALVERVWRVLEAACQDDALGTQLAAMAEEPLQLLARDDTCPDGILLEFNQMEVLVFTRQALHAGQGSDRGAALLNLTRRLFRLQRLDAIAREQAGGRDEAEVRLAYRLHGATRLDLPVPPAGMLYLAHAQLQAGELDNALTRVRSAEQSDAFLEYAADQDFWTAWLREQHAGRFAELEQGYRDSLTALSEQHASLNDPAFEHAARRLQEQYERQQRTLLKALTNQHAQAMPGISA